MLLIMMLIWCIILIHFSFVPATLIGLTFSFCYIKKLSSKKTIIYTTTIAPVITLLYFLIFFHKSASLANYLFFVTFTFCFTPLIAALRLKRIESVQKKESSKKTYRGIDVAYFIFIFTTLGFIVFCIFESNSLFRKLSFLE